MEQPVRLEADSIDLYFGERRILQNIYLSIPHGQVTAILGRNGCGKSCLMQIIFGTLRASYQSVRWNGKYIAKPYKTSGLVRYLPQKPLVPTSMRVERAFEWMGVSVSDRDLEKWDYYKSKRIYELSGGERRYLETLMILWSPVQFVLLDEPFSHLSPLYVSYLKAYIQAERQYKGILITDHYYRDVLEVSDRIYLLQNCTTQLLQNPLQSLKDYGYIPS